MTKSFTRPSSLIQSSVLLFLLCAHLQALPVQDAGAATQQRKSQKAQQRPATSQNAGSNLAGQSRSSASVPKGKPKPKPKVTKQPASGVCPSGKPIPLAVLNGTDADALAQTLSSANLGLVVTAAAQTSGKTAGSDDKAPVKDALCAASRNGSAADAASLANLMQLLGVMDTDEFKGVGLNSNFLIASKGLPEISKLVPIHPTFDIDITQVSDDRGAPQWYVLVPSTLLIGQAPGPLAQHAAAVKHDLLLLAALAARDSAPKNGAADVKDATTTENWVAANTVLLEALTPLSAKLILDQVLDPNQFSVMAHGANPSVTVLPKGLSADMRLPAQALERTILDGEQKDFDSLQSSATSVQGGSNKGSSAAASVTSSTIKTIITQASAKNPVTIATTTVPVPAQGNSGWGGAPAGPSSTANASNAMSSGSGIGGASQASASNQPGSRPAANFQMDRIIRLYHLRDATGIAAAINTLNAGNQNARPLVQALSDNGANDLLQILPPSAGQRDYAGDVARAVALLDLPRPQVSMQVWSYQISAELNAKNINTANTTTTTEAAKLSKKMSKAVEDANFRMRLALQKALATVFLQARNQEPKDQQFQTQSANAETQNDQKPEDKKSNNQNLNDQKKRKIDNPFFDRAFFDYLTKRYEDCVALNKYCLGYYDALQVPEGDSSISQDASLGRLLLFMAAASDDQYSKHQLDSLILAAMNNPYAAAGSVSPGYNHEDLCFSRFEKEVKTLAQPANLHTLRAAFLDFFFQYKWTVAYPKDFVPYDLQHSAHRLDDLLQPLIQAFDDDIDVYVQKRLDAVKESANGNRAGLSSFGTTRITALSGSPAIVSGQVSNYFDITQTPALSTVAQALFGGSGGAGGGAPSSSSNNGGGGGGGGGNKGNAQSTTSDNSAGSTGSSDSSKAGGAAAAGAKAAALPATVGNFIAANQIAAFAAAANIVSPSQVTAQVARGMTLSITPVSLDTASSAELSVNFSVNDQDAPQSVDTQAVKHDLLNRVATHQVNTRVRVQSLRLFDLSTFSMQLNHPQTPTCLPSFDDGRLGKAGTVIVNIPFAPVCAVWRSVFGSMPGANRLFSWPQSPKIIDNRSIAVIRAVVVPTAMDLGLSLRFQNDRVVDPVTNTTVTLTSTKQLNGGARPFHKMMTMCMLDGKDANGNTVDCSMRTFDDVKEDYRQTEMKY